VTAVQGEIMMVTMPDMPGGLQAISA